MIALLYQFSLVISKHYIHLGKDNLILCCTGSQDNYFWLVGQQNGKNNNKFKGQQI